MISVGIRLLSRPQVLREVLGALKKNRVGLAKEHCGPLAKAIGGDAEATRLLEDLQGLRGENVVSDERRKQGGNSIAFFGPKKWPHS